MSVQKNTHPTFHGDKKVASKSWLAVREKAFIERNIGKFPSWVEGWHLTMTTLLWSAGLLVFGFLAQGNLHWLWLSSLMIFLQWFTDSFDGALGRERDFGIPRWGFYMDHFLDYIFLSAVFVGYSFLVTGFYQIILFVLLGVSVGLMMSVYLYFGATNSFKIEHFYFGPTDMRILFIIINTFLIFFSVQYFEYSLVVFLAVFFVVLCAVVFKTQKVIWQIDMKEKKERLEKE